MDREVQAAIIGAGTAGLHALEQVRSRTDDFVIVNDGPYGTTCARVGCMPSKALIEASEVLHSRELYDEMGFLSETDVRVDGKAVLERVRRLRDRFTKGVRRATDSLDDRRSIPGRARILAPDLIEVNGERIRAGSLIIATGSKAVVPRPWQEQGIDLLTSDTVFEMQDLPGSMAVIGLGAIGLELAQAFARLGVEVTGFDALEVIGGITDPEVAGTAISIVQRDLRMHLGAQVNLQNSDKGVRVVWSGGSMEAERVLVAIGRRPAVDGLGLENLGVELDRRGLPSVDPHSLQVADLPVFLAGDVNGRVPLLHEAADDGLIAGYNATREMKDWRRFTRRTFMGIVFSDPNIARVGTSYGELDMSDAVVAEEEFSRQGRALTAGRNFGILRLYASRSTTRLLGAEMAVPAGEHFAHLLAWAVQRGLTVREMLELPYYHPVLEEGIRGALRKLAKIVDPRDPAPEVRPL